MSPRLNLDPRLIPAELLDELETGEEGRPAWDSRSMRAKRDRTRTKTAKAKTNARKRERERKMRLKTA